MANLRRRQFLQLLTAYLSLSEIPFASAKEMVFNQYPFGLGVASGSPSSDGFVLWTRLLGKNIDRKTPVNLKWEVFEEDRQKTVVARGDAVAIPELAHSLHIEVSGLRPDRWYGYRFIAGEAVSPSGRTRTLPLPDTEVSRLRIAYASCQRWEDGYFSAYRHMLTESLDLVIFLGDYIYESGARKRPAARGHNLKPAVTLDDYRKRYALYKSDPDLQRMHAACPWLITWDDHEVENNYFGTQSTVASENFVEKRNAAYQAFFEHMPLRKSALIASLNSPVSTTAVQLFGRYDFGRLARFHLLDNRQYRNASTRGSKALKADRSSGEPASMLGEVQERWLDDGFNKSPGDNHLRWNFVCQQTAFSPRNYLYGMGKHAAHDIWDAYPLARQRLVDTISRHASSKTVFLGGDIHQNWVAHVHQSPYDARSPVVAVEFCGTSISSRSKADDEKITNLLKDNPHSVFADAENRGYGVVDIQEKKVTVTLRIVDDVTRQDSGVSTLRSFFVEEGRVQIQTRPV
jgi:alkaline phosphatase D